MASNPTLLAFVARDYARRGWEVPDVHVRIYDWLERTEGARNRVLLVFRGAGKSTALGERNAWKLQQDPTHQLLVQGADDELTDDISRDTISILRVHPWTQGLLMEPAGVRHWWTWKGFEVSARTPQLRGRGILSRVTGNRADEIQNDDVEVAKNVETAEARAKLRKRLMEQSFILKPRGSKTWVGTPHTHDTIYDELIEGGAEVLHIPLFKSQTRHEPTGVARKSFTFKGEVESDGVWVFVGIGNKAKLLEEGKDFERRGKTVVLKKAIAGLVDICTGNAWPERFDRAEMLQRRRECTTINYWDQQYMLIAKPLVDSRLDPEAMVPYDVEPVFKRANAQLTMWLGGVRIVGAVCRWDPASGKLTSDASAVTVVFQDESGRRYIHRIVRLEGKIVEHGDDGKTVTGGQVAQLCDLVATFKLPRVTIETNGIGAFAPAVLKGALKQRRIICGVTEEDATANKNRRILEALEPLLLTDDQLWAHVSVLDDEDGNEGKGLLPAQMKDWNPAVTKQPDDYLDVVAGAVTETPERIHARAEALPGIPGEVNADSWRPSSGVHQIEIEAGIVD